MKSIGYRGTISTKVKYSSFSIHETIIVTTDDPIMNPATWFAYAHKICQNHFFFQYQPMHLDAEFNGESDFDIKRGVNPRFD